MKNGLLLLNLGTPDSPKKSDVRRYLRVFLSDPRVINIPAPLRYLLLYGLILPFRTRKTAQAYQAIWTSEGSPLLSYSQRMLKKVESRLKGTNTVVSLGMRYGSPSAADALKTLQHCDQITILPLFPQYSSAATGSSIAYVLKQISSDDVIPSMHVIRDFHQHPAFLEAQAESIKPYIADHDFILFSYHGVPENHLLKRECQQQCIHACSPSSARYESCYRQQCIRSTRLLAEKLNLSEQKYTLSFQSRLGKTPWIKPYTDDVLPQLASKGIKRLAISCPSFVVDCLETIEEIGIRAREQWTDLGGESLTLIPALNDDESWVEAVLTIAGVKPEFQI